MARKKYTYTQPYKRFFLLLIDTLILWKVNVKTFGNKDFYLK